MNNQEKLNNLFASAEDVDVKFFVADTSEGTQSLCGEALRIFDMHKNGKLAKSSVMKQSRGSVQSAEE